MKCFQTLLFNTNNSIQHYSLIYTQLNGFQVLLCNTHNSIFVQNQMVHVFLSSINMDPHTWPCKSRTTNTNIDSATMWGYGMLSRRPAWGDERKGKAAREGQGYPCYQHMMMMMMMMISRVYIVSSEKGYVSSGTWTKKKALFLELSVCSINH